MPHAPESTPHNYDTTEATLVIDTLAPETEAATIENSETEEATEPTAKLPDGTHVEFESVAERDGRVSRLRILAPNKA